MENREIDDLAARLQHRWDDDTWIALWAATKSKRRLARRDVWIRGMDDDDLDRVMELATWKALKTWRRGKGDCFLTWVARIWRCELLNVLKAESGTHKRMVLWESVELTDWMCDVIPEPERDDLQERVQVLRLRLARLYETLPPTERQILGYRLAQCEYAEIARRTGLSVKQVDNMLLKIRRKAKAMGT